MTQDSKPLDDGRPMNTDMFLVLLTETVSDHFDFREAIDCWIEGDWKGAMAYTK